MASIYTTQSGSVLIIPDSAVDINVATEPAGLASSGVVTIIGEANEGDSWTQDKANGKKLAENSYSPTDINRVVAKYGSGRIVDAFRGIASPSASARIQGAPNRVIIVKTNSSAKASRTLLDNHGEFEAKRGGKLGNQIQEEISTAQLESAPSTGFSSYAPSASAASLALRVNGGAAQTLAISANTTPTALASALTQLDNINAVGGVNKVITQGLTVADTIELEVVSGQEVKVKLASPDLWANDPEAGDTLHIPSGSVIAGGASENVGWYIITAVSNSTTSAELSATKITAGAPLAVAAVAFSATPNNDIRDYSSIAIDNMSGTDRNALAALVGINASLSVVASSITFTLASGSVFASTPRVGDIAYIPSGSAFDGASNENIGWYEVTEVSNTTTSAYIKADRLSNGTPVAVASTAIVAVDDVQILDKQIKGSGKALEIYDNAGTVNINTLFYELASDSEDAAWLSQLLVSDAELMKNITIKRASTNTEEAFSNIGGNIALKMGYNGTSASATILLVGNDLHLQTTVVGGSGANLDINLEPIATIADLVSQINLQPGYSAEAGSTLDAQRNPEVLDRNTFTIASSLGSRPGRLKRDIYDLTLADSSLSVNSSLVSYNATATAGLPEDNSFAFLTGGLKGATTGLQFAEAIDALQAVRTNFVVPLVSQDASADIAIADTESASTYSVDAVNVAIRAHCIAMSNAKIKRNRIGLVSKRGTFQAAKNSALTMANFRIGHTFQDVSDLNGNGDIQQFQPWMGAVKAAGMQAAGSYKAIFNKTVNITKAIQAAGDFDDENVTDCEDAILAGLMPLQRQETGGYNFLTDQTTYGIDNNVVYNSMQAVYVADLMALSLAQSLKVAFVGESVADVTTATAISFIKGKMAEFLSAKFTVGTQQYPEGWKVINVRINGNVLEVDVVAILANAIKFIPISLSIEGIKASASA